MSGIVKQAVMAPAGLAEAARPELGRRPATPPIVGYRAVEEFPGWEKAADLLRLMIGRWTPQTVFEVGSGANPTLSNGDVRRYGLRYITSDRDPGELGKADPAFEARCVDLERGPIPGDLAGRCDLVFSRMVNEHIRDGRRYHANIYDMLSPGGVAVHAFSTLYTMPFLANYLMPSRVGNGVFNFFAPRDRHQHDKFRAYYSWSRGPMPRAVRQFQQLGYDVASYDGYFGHLYYRSRMPLLDRLEQAKTRLLLRLRLPLFCSYAVIVLRKPDR